jgi:hypothetical protein
LPLGHLGVDAFVIDAGGEAEIEMLLDDLSRDRADILVANAGVIGPLWRRIAVGREAERPAVLVQEIFLLEAEPGAFVVENGRPLVRGMRRDAIRHHDFAQHQHAVRARGVREDADRFEDAVGAVALGLLGRASVEAPKRKLFQRREAVIRLDLCLAAQVGRGRVSVEPNVLELVLCHSRILLRC